jgi:hypothetical protein
LSLKYNHRYLNHRLWLAQNLLNVLQKWGFEVDEEVSPESCEFVLSRWDKYDLTKKVVVYTSIDKRSGAIRSVGSDAIRVISLRIRNNDEPWALAHKKIYRTGKLKNIVDRTLTAIKGAQKIG